MRLQMSGDCAMLVGKIPTLPLVKYATVVVRLYKKVKSNFVIATNVYQTHLHGIGVAVPFYMKVLGVNWLCC
jgi:hypothetical protein